MGLGSLHSTSAMQCFLPRWALQRGFYVASRLRVASNMAVHRDAIGSLRARAAATGYTIERGAVRDSFRILGPDGKPIPNEKRGTVSLARGSGLFREGGCTSRPRAPYQLTLSDFHALQCFNLALLLPDLPVGPSRTRH